MVLIGCMSIFSLAGDKGFEPPNDSTRNRRLAIQLRPIRSETSVRLRLIRLRLHQSTGYDTLYGSCIDGWRQ